METITAAIITSSVTFLSVIVAVVALRRQFVKDRAERNAANEARKTEANRQARLMKEATEARTLAEHQRVEAIERADRHRAEDADRRERAAAYSDFLVAESARSDAFADYAHVRKQLSHTPFKKGTPEEDARVAEIEARLRLASDEIDRTRAESWGPLATMRLVASHDVLRAADAYDKELAASNPRREKMPPVPLTMNRKRDLIDAFLAAARADLGRSPVERQVLVSADESNEEEPEETPIGQD
ncbi:hypothetical protein [Microbacterium sp. ER1]|uniref:hypothetical protein n=1 Tax=unclassified Microbacterium TaxID=2609290 RepID=UPI00201A7E37|nr:hypothetical protein [Microbacterium sp. ER1]